MERGMELDPDIEDRHRRDVAIAAVLGRFGSSVCSSVSHESSHPPQSGSSASRSSSSDSSRSDWMGRLNKNEAEADEPSPAPTLVDLLGRDPGPDLATVLENPDATVGEVEQAAADNPGSQPWPPDSWVERALESELLRGGDPPDSVSARLYPRPSQRPLLGLMVGGSGRPPMSVFIKRVKLEIAMPLMTCAPTPLPWQDPPGKGQMEELEEEGCSLTQQSPPLQQQEEEEEATSRTPSSTEWPRGSSSVST